MAKNVRFIRTTKEKWLARDTYDPLALYFCEDTQEMCKGDQVLTDGIRVVPTKADLPECPYAADGIIYYVTETKNGYMMSPDRTEWLQTIYAPAKDVTTIPESEIYKTVTTVGAVRDIEAAIYKYIDEEIANVEVSGSQGKDGADGEDGKTPYIQDGYWYIDGVSTGVKAEGVDGKDGTNGKDGKDGYTPVKGVDYFDGQNGKDGANGKDGYTPIKDVDYFDGKNGVDGKNGADGDSAYQVWLNAGHSGSEDDFLQWLKGDTEPFGNIITSISFGGIEAGTSLKGKTIKEVLEMLLGATEAPKPVVEQIIEKSIPAYSGTANSQVEEVEYMLLDAETAEYDDQGFYTATDEEGNVTSAGYQLTIEGNNEADAQVVSIPVNAVIKMAYKYDLGGTNTWLPYTFDTEDEANYWVLGETFTVTVDGEEFSYQTYTYNIDVVGGGDALTTTEYWRFEIEVIS